MSAAPLLEVENLVVRFRGPRAGLFGPRGTVHAVDGVGFTLGRGRTLGIVGESGSGKSTIAHAIMRLVPITGGAVRLAGRDLIHLGGRALREARRDFQMVFQDPFSALNPRRRAAELILEPMALLGVGEARERQERLEALLALVGLPPGAATLFPHQFSGGQRQRLMIARALSTNPALVVCDEPVSALDVAIQAQILNLLKRLQADLGLTYLFISHDLGVIQHLCDDVLVMYLGQIVEQAPAASLFAHPRHPYSWSLIAAAAHSGKLRNRLKRRFALDGDPPSPLDPPEGCRFARRCPFAETRCRQTPPPRQAAAPGHFVACHRADEIHAIGRSLL